MLVVEEAVTQNSCQPGKCGVAISRRPLSRVPSPGPAVDLGLLKLPPRRHLCGEAVSSQSIRESGGPCLGSGPRQVAPLRGTKENCSFPGMNPDPEAGHQLHRQTAGGWRRGRQSPSTGLWPEVRGCIPETQRPPQATCVWTPSPEVVPSQTSWRFPPA